MNEEQFDQRYRLEPQYEDRPATQRRSEFVLGRQREFQAQLKRRPINIAYFEELLDLCPLPDDVPQVGCFCNMIPVEIIYALGARPVRLGCGNAALVQPGEEVLAGEICPLVKASFGMFLDAESPANRCDVILIPTSCDAKRKLGEVLSDYKPTLMFNLPPEQDAKRYGKTVATEIARMADFLSERLGKKLSTGALLAAIDMGQRRARLLRRLQEVRAAKPAALSLRDLFIVVQSSFTGVNLEEWLREAECVLDEMENFEPERKRLRPRMVLAGAPIIWPNFKVLNLIEESGADVVADTLCTGAHSCFDPVVYDEKNRTALMRALGFRYVFASTCPCFVSQGTRISRVLELVEEFEADGVINHSLRLCQLFDMEVYRLSRILKERKIPSANIRTDYSLEDTEQLRVRLEAFLETVGED